MPEGAGGGQHEHFWALRPGQLQDLVHGRRVPIVVELREQQQQVQAQPRLVRRPDCGLAALHVTWPVSKACCKQYNKERQNSVEKFNGSSTS